MGELEEHVRNSPKQSGHGSLGAEQNGYLQKEKNSHHAVTGMVTAEAVTDVRTQVSEQAGGERQTTEDWGDSPERLHDGLWESEGDSEGRDRA